MKRVLWIVVVAFLCAHTSLVVGVVANPPFKCTFHVSVVDELTGSPIKAKILLYHDPDRSHQKERSYFSTDESGKATIKGRDWSTISIGALKEGYYPGGGSGDTVFQPIVHG